MDRVTARFASPDLTLMTGGEASILDPFASYSDIDEPYEPTLVLSDCDAYGDVHFVVEGGRDAVWALADELLELRHNDELWEQVTAPGLADRAEYEDEDDEEQDDEESAD